MHALNLPPVSQNQSRSNEASGAPSSGDALSLPLHMLLASATEAASSVENNDVPTAGFASVVFRNQVLERAMVNIKKYRTDIDTAPSAGAHKVNTAESLPKMAIDNVFPRFVDEFVAALKTLQLPTQPARRRARSLTTEVAIANQRSASASHKGKDNDLRLGSVIVRFVAYIVADYQKSSARSARPLREVMRLQRFVRVFAQDKQFFAQYLYRTMGIVACFADPYAEFHRYHRGAVDAVFDGRSLRLEPPAPVVRRAPPARADRLAGAKRAANDDSSDEELTENEKERRKIARVEGDSSSDEDGGIANPSSQTDSVAAEVTRPNNASEASAAAELARQHRAYEARLSSKRRVASYQHLRFLARSVAIAIHTNDFECIEISMKVVADQYARNPRGFPLDTPCAVASVAAILKQT